MEGPMTNGLTVSLIVLACVLGGAVLGMVLRKFLAADRFSDESKDLIKMGTALLSTLTALVPGLLITSSKNSADVTGDEIKQIAAKIIQLDRNLRHYGSEASEVRDLLRRMVTANTDLLWTGAAAPVRSTLGQGGVNIEGVQEMLRTLAPNNDAQRWLQSRALQIATEIEQVRWLALERSEKSISIPFLVVLVLWLVVIFTCFGLLAPRHGIAYAVIVACALSVSGAIFLIEELNQPFAGLLKISDAPMRHAIAEMNQ
jgi:hypothetical protein